MAQISHFPAWQAGVMVFILDRNEVNGRLATILWSNGIELSKPPQLKGKEFRVSRCKSENG